MEKNLPNDIFFTEVENLVAEGNDVRMLVRGTSMRTFINAGDTVLLSPCVEEDLIAGALILFRYNKTYLLHRLKQRDGNELTFQGDSVKAVERAAVTDVVGVVREVLRADGSVVTYPSDKWTKETSKSLRLAKIRFLLYPIKKRLLGPKSISQASSQ